MGRFSDTIQLVLNRWPITYFKPFAIKTVKTITAVVSGLIALRPPTSTFTTSGREIRDTRGKPILLRGVNKMSVYDNDDPQGVLTFAEIAKSKANTVRIVWAIATQEGPTSPARLDALITNAWNNKLVPMVELHDATGNWARLVDLVNYWVQPQIVAILQKHQQHLLVNIGNEVGDHTVDDATFLAGYSSAITRMRNAGILAPLVIDAPDWGKELTRLNNTAAQLVAADPQKRLIFSVHLYWPATGRGTAQNILTELQGAVARNYPLVVGEFSEYGAYPGSPGASICSPGGRVDYRAIIEVCHQLKIGWYAWEWGPGNGFNDPLCTVMDMTSDRRFANLKPGWATEVATTSPYSIAKTSLPAS
jgi:mannan endo-1,4-beta-mannosidase